MALRFETDGHLATLTIDSPETGNALGRKLRDELTAAWLRVRDDPQIWVAVITGAGGEAFATAAEEDDGEPWRFWQTQEGPQLERGLELWKPVVAAVNGRCSGSGMALLFATDIRVAAERATFALDDVVQGRLPAGGVSQRLLQQLRYAQALELLLTGEPISAGEAYRAGLVNRVVPAERVLPAARELAERLCQNPPLTVRAIKELAVRGQDLSLADALRLEQAVQRVNKQTEDAKEGPRSFAERRPPRYSGR